jgi:hypothetical protein
MEEMANLEAERLEVLIESLSGLNRYDFLLFDTSAGISKSVISLCLASSEVVLVIAPEPTSLTDSFALLKILSLNGFPGQARVVVNQCKSSEIAAMAYKKFKSAAVKYLNIDVPTLGMIYQDPKVAEAVKQQQPLLSLYPDSSASKCIRQIGERLLSAGMEHLKQDDMVSFWSRCRQLMSGPLKLPSSKKKSDEHSPEPAMQESKSKMHQVAREDRQEDLPDKRSDSAAAAGLASEKPTAQSSTSSLEETQQLTNAQVLESSKPAETANLQRLLLLMETVIGAVSSLTKELELVRKAIARHEKSSLSRESFLFELTPKA